MDDGYIDDNWVEKTTLTPFEERIRKEEGMLIELANRFKQSNNDYSNLLVKLIYNELKEPRL